MRIVQAVLVFIFRVILTGVREVRIAWEVAQVHVFHMGSMAGLCACGFALDDHLPDGDCPIDLDDDDEDWVEVIDDEDDGDEE